MLRCVRMRTEGLGWRRSVPGSAGPLLLGTGCLDGLQQVLACVLQEREGAVQVAGLGLQQGLKAKGRQGTRLPVR